MQEVDQSPRHNWAEKKKLDFSNVLDDLKNEFAQEDLMQSGKGANDFYSNEPPQNNLEGSASPPFVQAESTKVMNGR